MRLIPRDERFFDMFAELAKRLTGSAKLLCELMAEPQRLDHYVGAIKALEHEADNLAREVNQRLDTAFVTPLDREDIHLLASRIDNVIDLVDGTARRAKMYHIGEVRQPAKRLAEILVRSTEQIAIAVSEMKRPKQVAERAKDIKRLEEEGDAVYFEAVGALFANGMPALEVIKWKDLYDKLEDALDECENVSNTLESISLKNS